MPPAAPLLASKLHVPPARAHLVSRPRLLARIAEPRPLLLVSAPAGFGKTTLVSEGTQTAGVGWLSLDDDDNDPPRFLAYAVASLRGLIPGAGETALALLQSPQSPPLKTILTSLVNDLSAAPAPFALVLDDYHAITAQPIHDALAFLIDHLPPQMRLILITRADPPLPLARMRARNQLTEIRAADLRFTPEEAADFLNRAMGLALTAGDVAALEQRTEGWIAGLQLAALSLQGRQDAPAFIAAFAGSHRFVLEYLAEEVLQRQPEAVQTFLLRTSFLDRLTGPLCEAVAGQEGGQEALRRLESANLFVIPLDDSRTWYRYHHLFADFLRHRLRQTAPALPAELHRCASKWYADNQLMAEAIGHALAAKDFEHAADLIDGESQSRLMSGDPAAVLNWAGALPDESIRPRRRLCLTQAWAMLITGRIDGIEPRLQDAERGLDDGEPARIIRGEALAIRATIATAMQDYPRALELSHRSLELASPDNIALRGAVMLNLGIAYAMKGDAVEAARILAEAAAHNQAAGNTSATVFTLWRLANMLILQGKFDQASRTLSQAQKLGLGPQGRPLPFASVTFLALANIAYEQNDLDAARQLLPTAVELAGQWGDTELQAGCLLLQARLSLAEGRRDLAVELLDRADETMRGHPFYSLSRTASLVAAHRMRLWILEGDLPAARRWAEQRQLRPDDEPAYARESEYIGLAWLLAAQPDSARAALSLLARIRRNAESGGRIGNVIEVLAIQSLALQTQGSTSQALDALGEALALAEPCGYIRIFADLGPAMAALLAKAASRRIAPEYAAKLLAASGQEESERWVAKPPPAPDALVEPLTERERQTLRLLAAGLSNREIADELIVSVDTVKTHLRGLYGKLGAHNRAQAILRARELNLL